MRSLFYVPIFVSGQTTHLLEKTERSLLSSVKGLSDVFGFDTGVTSGTLGGNLPKLAQKLLDLLPLSGVKLSFKLGHRLLSVNDEALALVGLFNDKSAGFVRLGVLLRVGNHLFNLVVGETGRRSNGHRLLTVGSLVNGRNVNDTISVDVEGDLDLRNTFRCRRKAGELEVTEKLVVSNQFSLSLVHLNLDGGLTVSGSGESLGLLGGDSSVSVDETSEDTTKGLDTKGKGGNIEKENVSNVTGKNTGLDRSTDGDRFVRVDTLTRLPTESRLDSLNDLGHSAHTTNENDVVDLGSLDTRVAKSLLTGLNSSVNERLDNGFETGTGEVEVDVLRTLRSSSDVRKRDVGGTGRRQLALGLLGSFPDSLNSHSVARNVNTCLLLELGQDVVDKSDVEVFTTKMGVTVGRLDLENTLLHLKDRDIESTTTQVVDSNHRGLVLVETIGKSSGSRLVDDTKDFKTSDRASILGSLTLRVVEVSRDSDDWSGGQLLMLQNQMYTYRHA